MPLAKTVSQYLAEPSNDEYLRTIRSSMALGSRGELLAWWRRDLQRCLPHDALIAAWHGAAAGSPRFEVLSDMSGLLDGEIQPGVLSALHTSVQRRWKRAGCQPIHISPDDLEGGQPARAGLRLPRMTGALAHGYRDERVTGEALYIVLCRNHQAIRQRLDRLVLMLPSIDLAFRRMPVATIGQPMQQAAAQPAGAALALAKQLQRGGLSERECGVMRLVCQGKTNAEIGALLGISPITVRNHLQHVFRKLNAVNRAQAVFEFEALAN